MGELISIILSIYKEPIEWLKESIYSLISQSYNNIEIIVVVDNPEHKDAIAYLEELSKNDNRLKYYINSENVGLVKSLNRALQYCSGEYIARMDADDISAIDRIMDQYEYLISKQLDMVGCQMYCFDAISNNIVKEMKCVISSKICKHMVKYCSCLNHPTWLVKKHVYDNLNGYREIDACEDFDFLNRAVLSGYRIGNLPKTQFKYRLNPKSISNVKKTKQYLTMKFLSQYYRKNKLPSVDQLNEYLDSNQYNKDAYEYSKFSYNSSQKISSSLYLLFSNRLLRRQKIDNFKMKILSCIDQLYQ